MANTYPNLRRISELYAGRAALLRGLARLCVALGTGGLILGILGIAGISFLGSEPQFLVGGVALLCLAAVAWFSGISLAAVGELLVAAADTAQSTTALAEHFAARPHGE